MVIDINLTSDGCRQNAIAKDVARSGKQLKMKITTETQFKQIFLNGLNVIKIVLIAILLVLIATLLISKKLV